MTHEPVNVERLQKAIVVWETVIRQYRTNTKDIKARHKLTWWLRKDFWKNDKAFSKGFKALINRRTQLQTAIKNQKES